MAGMDGQSSDILSKKLAKLKELYPEAFTEDQIDWEKLQATLGNQINLSQERYHLNWAGKSEVFRILQQRTSATLIPVPEESYPIQSSFCHSDPAILSEVEVSEEGSQSNINNGNIFIEGENLEVLKVLQKSYFGKIKMIYIDPPYNTGSDSFIYPDRFAESKDEYLKRIGDKDEEGFLLKEGMFRKNSKDSGHYHSNWLSMMYPRLYLARNLLRDDGVIFVSIDDNEVHNLRMIMNEIFGEENFLAQLIWNLRSGSQAGHFTGSHEYILSFAKSKESLKYFSDNNGGTIRHGALKKISADNPESEITFPAGIEFEGDNAEFESELGGSEKEFIKNGKMIFVGGKLKHPVTISAGWAMRNQILSWLDNKETFDSKGQKVLKFFFNRQGILWYEKERGTIHPKTVLPDDIGNTKTGTDQIVEIFGKKIMDFPKPYELIKFLVEVVLEDDGIVLDFFAGSGTTAQAVMELNKEDGGNRKFILVQLPEKTDENSEAYKAGYKTIADICKERIRRVIEKINRRDAEAQSEIFASQSLSGEKMGFKVFELAPSNFKIWRSDVIENTEDLEKMMNIFHDQVKPNAEKENMFYELLLKSGYPLNVETAYVPSKEGGYYSINSNEIIILLEAIDQAIVDAILKLQPKNVIALDKLFVGNDQLKTNTVLQMKDAEIEFRTV